uniref:Uncharacterized protein n=1 Tax=Rhipicephalus zambeziensis TaxID=60191 RepID=A0A224YHW9_9ACAR
MARCCRTLLAETDAYKPWLQRHVLFHAGPATWPSDCILVRIMFVVEATLPVLQQLVTASHACETTVAVQAGNSERVSPAGSFSVPTMKPRPRPENVTSNVLLWLLPPLLGAFHFIFIALKTTEGVLFKGWVIIQSIQLSQ